MDNNIHQPHSPEGAFDIIRKLREDVTRHEQLLDKIITILQQQAVTSTRTSEWIPYPVVGGVVEPMQSSPKIRKIEVLGTKPHDIVGRLRKTWLGRVYRSHLKQDVVIRWTVQWLWRNGYPIYVNIDTRFFNRKAKRWRPITKLSEFTKKREISACTLVNAVVVETPKPKVFPACDQGYLILPHDRYQFPEIFVAIIKNAMTYGGTNLILADGEVVCHDLYDFKRDYTSEELHGRTLIDPKSRRIRWLLHDEAPEPIPVAASFVDACALNYAHWMTEVLPRIALFCTDERFKGVPIVINEGLHQNIMESLLLVVGAEREIIILPIGRALAVDKLYITSVTGYVPFEPRMKNQTGGHHGIFNPYAFAAIKFTLNEYIQKLKSNLYPKKIYIRRNSTSRNIINKDEVERMLIRHGYSIVEPENLSFSEQVAIFSNANSIIGPVGAALANSIFIQKGTKIGVLVTKHKDMLYGYWPNVMSPQGAEVSYILGDIKESEDCGVHSNFHVPIASINDFIEDITNVQR